MDSPVKLYAIDNDVSQQHNGNVAPEIHNRNSHCNEDVLNMLQDDYLFLKIRIYI